MSLATTAGLFVLALSPTTELGYACRLEGDIASSMTYAKNAGTPFSQVISILEDSSVLEDYMHVALLVYSRSGTPREIGNYVESSCLETR